MNKKRTKLPKETDRNPLCPRRPECGDDRGVGNMRELRVQTLLQQIRHFRSAKRDRECLAGERASCLLTAGIDLDRVIRLSFDERKKTMMRLRRLIERERLKGTRGHWSYDLNRHIALTAAAERVRRSLHDKDGACQSGK